MPTGELTNIACLLWFWRWLVLFDVQQANRASNVLRFKQAYFLLVFVSENILSFEDEVLFQVINIWHLIFLGCLQIRDFIIDHTHDIVY